jgi:hypothetical protein
MNKEEQNIADVTFIFSEVVRFARMSPEEVTVELRKNPGSMFAHLSRSKGGILFCGRSAYDRFEDLAERTIKPGTVKDKDFERRDYVHALRQAFVEIFIEAGQSVQQGSVTKLLNRAEKLASEGLVHLTHHIPCVFIYDKKPPKFQLGPVSFTVREAFFDEVNAGLAEYHQTWIERYAEGLRKQGKTAESEVRDEAKSLANRHLANIHDFYDDYDWVASITIPPVCIAA